MKIKDVGEFGLIDIISRAQHLTGQGITGIGDDCAVIPAGAGRSYVITTDMLVEGKHFILDNIGPYDLGYKSLAVNVSDVISMGAEPKYSFLSVSADPDTPLDWFERFIDGYGSFGVPLLGGDTTAGEKGTMVLNIAMIGEIKTENIKYRGGAHTGDIIAVTGHLGASAAGLRAILNGYADKYPEITRAHNHPEINVEGGIWLGKQKAVHAMTDISDGIASDLLHICEKSGCGAVIDTELLPVSEETKKYCRDHGTDAIAFAIGGGEDYSLLVTIGENDFARIKENFPGELYEIGRITDGKDVKYIIDGKATENMHGFRHF